MRGSRPSTWTPSPFFVWFHRNRCIWWSVSSPPPARSPHHSLNGRFRTLVQHKYVVTPEYSRSTSRDLRAYSAGTHQHSNSGLPSQPIGPPGVTRLRLRQFRLRFRADEACVNNSFPTCLMTCCMKAHHQRSIDPAREVLVYMQARIPIHLSPPPLLYRAVFTSSDMSE